MKEVNNCDFFFSIVSMDRFEAIEFLKLYFGTLFLSSYKLPTLDHAIVIFGNGVKIFLRYRPFVSMGCILRHLITKVLNRREELRYLCRNDFLNAFSDRLHLIGDCVAPKDLTASPNIFFQKFFDSDYTPQNEEEINAIVEWCMFAVQFEESSLARVNAAIELLKGIRDHLYHAKLAAMFDQTMDNLDKPLHRFDTLVDLKSLSLEDEDMLGEEQEEEKEKLAPLSSPNEVRKDYDSKPCDCDEYEASGDCYHAD